MADRDTTGTGGPDRKASAPTDRPHDRSDRDRSDRDPDRGADFDRMAADTRNTVEHGFNAQGRIRSLLEQQTHRAADQLGGVADALHKAAEQLSEENNGTAARYADQAADRVGQVADMLRDSTVDDMVSEVERFARRQPEVFVGAAFALGFLAARFIKSSGERRGGRVGVGDARLQGGSSYRPDPRVTGRAGDTGTYERYRAGAGSPSTARPTVGTEAGMSAGHTNAATAATAAARARDAAQMAVGTPARAGTTGAVAGPAAGLASQNPVGQTTTGQTTTGQTAMGQTGKDPTGAGHTPASQTPAAKLGLAPSGTAKPQETRP